MKNYTMALQKIAILFLFKELEFALRKEGLSLLITAGVREILRKASDLFKDTSKLWYANLIDIKAVFTELRVACEELKESTALANQTHPFLTSLHRFQKVIEVSERDEEERVSLGYKKTGSGVHIFVLESIYFHITKDLHRLSSSALVGDNTTFLIAKFNRDFNRECDCILSLLVSKERVVQKYSVGTFKALIDLLNQNRELFKDAWSNSQDNTFREAENLLNQWLLAVFNTTNTTN